MKTKNHHIHLLRTKLHRPPIPADHVPRLELLKRLDNHPDRPLVLVSAPAGYGKSTLVSCWLEGCGKPSAWLSLDETDDDLPQFLSGFLAEPGGWIRPLVELGEPMADLLRQLPKRDATAGHARKILAAFDIRQPTSPPSQVLDEPLFHRELDFLEPLSKRLQNKEIADILSISPKTVKAQLSSIYQKLQVANRREAVEKAALLKILPSPGG